jgi:hypothetical protein
MAELKTKQNENNVVEFLNSIGDEQRKLDCLVLIELFKEITNESPKMWGTSIVGFGSYHYKYDSGREGDSCLIGFSPRKQNLTIYITAGFKEYDDIMQELGKYKIGSSCLYVKRLSDINTAKLKELANSSIAFIKKKYGEKTDV